MITHKSSLLELGPWRAGEHDPPGPGGAQAQHVGSAGGGDVSIVTWLFVGAEGLFVLTPINLLNSGNRVFIF